MAAISQQTSLPADTVFGRWMSQTASLVAGDVFATEDRLAGLAASAVVGGLAAVGNRPLVGLDGHLLAPGQATGAVLLAWAARWRRRAREARGRERC